MELGIVLTVAVAALSAAGLLRALWSHEGRTGFDTAPWSLVETGAGFFLMMGMLYAATAQVVVRYWLSEYLTLSWTEELSRVLLVWSAFWGAAMLQRSDDHIRVALLVAMMPQKAQLAARLLGDIVALAFLALVVWHGLWMAQSLLEVPTITLGAPVAVFAYSVPVGGALMMVFTIRLMMRRIRGQPIRSIHEEQI